MQIPLLDVVSEISQPIGTVVLTAVLIAIRQISKRVTRIEKRLFGEDYE